MKNNSKILMGGIIILVSIGLSACDNALPGQKVAIEIDDDVKNQEHHALEEDYTFEKLVIGKRLEGYSQQGPYKFPYYFVFSKNGSVKMYTRPFDDQDWNLTQEFKIIKGRVTTDREDIDDIIDWVDVLKLNALGEIEDLSEEGSENLEGLIPEDGINVTLYPEGTQVGSESPFNMKMRITSAQNMSIDFLKHDITIDKITDL